MKKYKITLYHDFSVIGEGVISPPDSKFSRPDIEAILREAVLILAYRAGVPVNDEDLLPLRVNVEEIS